ncbi:cupin domain-containing protein [Bacillus swezeyi]|uniref:hypothetical protein n=1 Tax=Bacillus swezeyi TaxID=1925020 RepID=UPI0027DBCB2E|nr:hypothetical protein [Bacillus swezeyi]
MCLLDQDVPHSIPALGKNDIFGECVLEDQCHDRYILFYWQDNDNLQYILKNMM